MMMGILERKMLMCHAILKNHRYLEYMFVHERIISDCMLIHRTMLIKMGVALMVKGKLKDNSECRCHK